MNAIYNYFSPTATPTKEPIDNEMIELVKLKLGQQEETTRTSSEMKAELLSTEKALLQVLELVKSDPVMLEKVKLGLDPKNPLHAITEKLLSEDLSSSQIILSDEKKADEWFDQISAENIKLLNSKDLLKEQAKKEPWRYYHIVTVPAKYTYKAGRLLYKGYCIASNLLVPITLGALVIQSPWLPILRLLLGRIL